MRCGVLLKKTNNKMYFSSHPQKQLQQNAFFIHVERYVHKYFARIASVFSLTVRTFGTAMIKVNE